MSEWNFYGRTEPLAELRRIVESGRWFFCRIEGRRRIGKTTLLSELAKKDADLSNRLVYMQVPDSDERDVAYTFRQSLSNCEHEQGRTLATGVTNFATMAASIGRLCAAGFIVVIDEFQYFTRSKLYAFNSFLQAEVDKLRGAQLKHGGLFVLGSLQSEMNALLDDKSAPLYGRVTAQIPLDHWDFEDLLSVFASQGLQGPNQWLTLWTFFEGVPKFYHDAYEQELFQVAAPEFSSELLRRMFIRSSSPLSEEADTWFLRELRGKAVSVLHFLADHAGCSHAEIVAALTDEDEKKALGTHIARLVDRYKMVDKLQPVFSDSKSRNARYYIADNFLQAWLAVAKPAREEARLKPLEKAIAPALRRLETLEGFAFEKLIRSLHLETSRKGKGDFELSELKLGYWNRPRDASKAIEIDLVALDEANKKVRFGCCKRASSAHDLLVFEQHVSAFLQTSGHKHLMGWEREMVLFSPSFSKQDMSHYQSKGYVTRDLLDYANMFGNAPRIQRAQ
ncbi:ATP-binding protein [Alicycliphilus denitrificans]|uniref:ATP-binding protein n=1 Tax=Alicycliphilus denitrificans TaxID=179636 RepID=A0A420KFB4_9BURK|nr:ATP-binding protein [Alicycliphilus denitrificans]RKJ98603.1 ATP-binding protein [Alicycliphilus denitrificans]